MLLNAIFHTLAWSKRRDALRELVRGTIEREGGEVDRISIIGFLLRSPFPPMGGSPGYLRVDCRYPGDSGTWFIGESQGAETHWVWRSDTGAERPPIERTEPVLVANDLVVLPAWLNVVLYLLALVALLGGVWYVCVFV